MIIKELPSMLTLMQILLAIILTLKKNLTKKVKHLMKNRKKMKAKMKMKKIMKDPAVNLFQKKSHLFLERTVMGKNIRTQKQDNMDGQMKRVTIGYQIKVDMVDFTGM